MQVALATGVIGLVCCLISANSFAQSFAEQCETRLAPTKVKVKLSDSKYSVDYSKSYRELTDYGGRTSTSNYFVLGHVETKREVKAIWGTNSLSFNGQSCLRPIVEIQLNYAPMTMRIAREMKQNTCAFDFIQGHELQHVRIYDVNARNTAAKLESELVKFFGQKIFYGDLATMQQQLESAMHNYWFPLTQNWLKEADTENQKFDSPAEYAKASTVCGGIISKLVGK